MKCVRLVEEMKTEPPPLLTPALIPKANPPLHLRMHLPGFRCLLLAGCNMAPL